jgi:hypothetical protein
VRRGKEIDALWACTSRQIRHVLDLATVERDPTTVDRKGFVTLKVMSVRPVFSHSPITVRVPEILTPTFPEILAH